MKKAILILAGSLFLSVSIAQAQQDTTRTNNRTQQQTPATPQPQPQQQNQYRTDNMNVIQQDQLPSSMRETLQGTEYQGWERSTIYQDPATGDYLMEMSGGVASDSTNSAGNVSGNTATTPRTFRFDKNGKRLEDKSGGDNE